MENYNIYDEVGRGTHSFVYKARRKRSIEYVAVKSTAKCRMDKILNEVQFLHKLDSPFVLKFFNWYESQNHIWLIFEYCIGGDLLNLITQDKRLPEAAVKTFGSELLAGLQYLHCNGVLFCDLKPANILIDEFGSLKLADFGLARRIPTSETRFDAGPLAPGSPNYMAPELFEQPAIHSFASDFWALGCVLYEMATGKQAFTHTVFSELAHKIQTEALAFPDNDNDWLLSTSFRNLLDRLLHKNPHQRMSWDELMQHPFWDGCSPLSTVKMPKQELFDAGSPSYLRVHGVKKPQSCAVVASHGSRPYASDLEQNDPENDTNVEERSPRNNNSPCDEPSREPEKKTKASQVKVSRPATAPILTPKPVVNKRGDLPVHALKESSQKRAPESARAGNGFAMATETRTDDDQRSKMEITELAKLPSTAPAAFTQRRSPSRAVLLESAFDRDGKPGGGLRKLSKLILTAADCCVKPIVWSNEIEHLSLPSSRPELLPFAVLTADQLLSSDTEMLERHLKEIYINLKRSDMDTEEAAALMVHLFSYCCHPKLANVIINSSILALLTKTLTLEYSESSQRSPVLIGMTCLIVGVLFRYAAFFAPTSANQLQYLLQGLISTADQESSIALDTPSHSSASELDSRRLAISCLGEMLFYMSTQKELKAATFAWDRLISALRDDDLVIRHYAARALCNALSSCRDDSLLSKLSSEQVVTILARSIVEYSKSYDKCQQKAPVLAVWTTTTQAVVQVLRYLRKPSAKNRSASQQKCSVLVLLAKRNVMCSLWHGFQSGVTEDRRSLVTASLNALNVFLELKVDGCRDNEMETIELARGDLLERVVCFPPFAAVLEMKTKLGDRRQTPHEHDLRSEPNGSEAVASTVQDQCASDEEETTLLQAKVVILLHLGTQSSRVFVDRCLQAQVMQSVEQIFAPLAAIVRNDLPRREPAPATGSIATTITSSSSSTASQPASSLSPSDSHLLQCLLNLVKASIRTALKLGAECISSNERVRESDTGRTVILATPFKLLESLLRYPACRLQLAHYFVVNDNKQYTFFLRLMTKMLAVFPSESLDDDAEMPTVGVSLGQILLRLFQCAAADAREIVAVEAEILYINLLPTLADLIARDPGATTTDNSAELSVTSIRVIYLVLLQLDGVTGNEADSKITKHRETFVRACLLPRLCSLLMGDYERNENVWRFGVELLFGLLSKDDSLLSSADSKLLVPAIVQLLDTPRQRSYHSLPSSATKMAKMLVTGGKQSTDQQLYDADIVRCLMNALRFAVGKSLGGCLLDLLEILLQLLHTRYEAMRNATSRSPAPSVPRQFGDLIGASPLLAQLCAVYQDRNSPSKAGERTPGDGLAVEGESPNRSTRRAMSDHEAAVADLASRCIIFSSQLFGERLNDVLFAAEDKRGSSAQSIVARSFILCLERPDAATSTVVLRVLLTLKNSLRCQSNNSSAVSRWLADNPKMGKLLKRLATSASARQQQAAKRSSATTSEQIVKTAADIVRLCDAISPPRQS